jgi:hypothetical protein
MMETAVNMSPKWMRWTGLGLSLLPALGLLASATMKLTQQPKMVEMFTGKFGYPADLLVVIAVLELTCTVIYLIPQTAVLGAILLTGYLGGAVATHVRVSDHFAAPLIFGILVWAGLFLRDERVRALIPLRKTA